MKQELALQQVFETICLLHLDNKLVSVANVRNQMVIAAPLPIITKAITAFKADPELYLTSFKQNLETEIKADTKVTAKTHLTADINGTLEDRIMSLEQQVMQLTEKVEQLLLKR